MKGFKAGALLLAAAATFSFTLAGCSPSGGGATTAPAGTSAPAATATTAPAQGGAVTIAMLPKFKGENYFDAVKIGAEEAAKELGVTLLYDGPPQSDATNQNQVSILEGWIAQGVKAILLSPNDPAAIVPTVQKAQAAGIKVITFDADANQRDLFINQASYDAIGQGMVKAVADSLTGKGYGSSKPANISMISSAKTDANQNAWIAAVKKAIGTPEYNWLKLANEETDIYYPGPDETANQQAAGTLVSRMGPGANQIQAAIGLSSMATPALGAAYEAAAQKPDPKTVTMTGLATPNALKQYITNDKNPMDTGVIWSCMDLGYLSVQAAYQMANGTISGSSTTMTAGRLGSRDIADHVILLGPALIFDKTNIDKYNY